MPLYFTQMWNILEINEQVKSSHNICSPILNLDDNTPNMAYYYKQERISQITIFKVTDITSYSIVAIYIAPTDTAT